MGFSNVGPVITLEPGASHVWLYYWGNQVDDGAGNVGGDEDYGSIIAGPYLEPSTDPEVQSTGPQVAERQAKNFINFYDFQVQGWGYTVKITNGGSHAASHNLEGGGLV